MLSPMGSARTFGVLALLVIASLPATASAQLLQRGSDAVRGRYGASERRGAPPRRVEAPRGGGSGTGTARPSSPRTSSRREEPGQVDRTPPPRRRGGGPVRVGPPWAGVVTVPPPGASATTATVVTPDPPAAPVARDPLYGGSAGVRVVGRIGVAPREPEVVLAAPGSPVGTLVFVEEELEEPARPLVRGVIGFDGGYVLHGVARGALSARLELPPMIDVVLGYSGYLEPTDGGFDAIAIGRLGLGARIVDEDLAQLRLALSARHFHDWLGASFGIEALLGIDVVIYDATVLVIEGALGTLGETFSAQVRASIGVRPVDGLEIYAGYDHLVLQPFDGEVSAIELGGPMAGVRVVID